MIAFPVGSAGVQSWKQPAALSVITFSKCLLTYTMFCSKRFPTYNIKRGSFYFLLCILTDTVRGNRAGRGRGEKEAKKIAKKKKKNSRHMRTQPSPCNKTSLAPLWLLKSQDNIPAMTHHFWAKSPRVRVLQTICCLFQFIPGTSPFIAHSLKRMYVVNPPLCLWKCVSLATRDYLSDGLSVVLLRYNH